MSNFLTINPNPILSPYTKTLNPNNPRKTHLFNLSHSKSIARGSLSVVKLGLNQVPDESEGLIRDLFGRAEGLFYTVADVAASSGSGPGTDAKQGSDWFSGITYYMETVLKVLKDGLSTLHVPYSYGFAIILLTVLIKAATFPLTRKQVESAMAMKSLQPQIKAIQKRYAGDKERMQLETARLYKLAGINPLAGCLPTLATIPVWIGLYRALSNVANEGLLTEGFFWIPSLAGPTTVAARQNGSGISWLFPFTDGQPPLGWPETFAYLVLPVLLVVSQYVSLQIMQSSQANDPNMKSSQAITKFLPLMIGYFALSVPSGLSLYWLTNNILSTTQQVWLQNLGGAKNPVSKLGDNLIKEELKEFKPIVDSIAKRKEPTAEKPASDGPRPGDRFKQLKEQEARKKQQREEEKKRANEVAANATQTTEGRRIEDATSTTQESEAEVESTNSRNGSANSNLSSSSHNGVNGNLSTMELKEDKSTFGTASKENNLHEREKEEAVAAPHMVDIKDTDSSD